MVWETPVVRTLLRKETTQFRSLSLWLLPRQLSSASPAKAEDADSISGSGRFTEEMATHSSNNYTQQATVNRGNKELDRLSN